MEIEYSETLNTNQETSLDKNNINNILNSNMNNSITEITISTNTVKYDHSKKMDLVKKINKIKKKEYLFEIFKIITSESDDYSENNNGVFIFFHNLSDDTYDKLDQYVNNIYKMYKQTNTSNIFNTEVSDTINNKYSDTIEIVPIDKNLSNKEKMIMRRKKYEEYITHNQR